MCNSSTRPLRSSASPPDDVALQDLHRAAFPDRVGHPSRPGPVDQVVDVGDGPEILGAWQDRRVTGSPEERLARAVALRDGGEPDRARELLLALRTEFPADPHIAVQTAWVHDSLGLEEEAVAHYRAALAGDLADEELRGAFLGLGSTLRALGRDAEADEVFRLGGRRGSPTTARCGCSTRCCATTSASTVRRSPTARGSCWSPHRTPRSCATGGRSRRTRKTWTAAGWPDYRHGRSRPPGAAGRDPMLGR